MDDMETLRVDDISNLLRKQYGAHSAGYRSHEILVYI
jgi:hypothetical protein